MKYIMTIAGSDPSGGAGIQADLKTITRLGAHGLTVITAVTAQNSAGVAAVHKLPAGFIAQQIETLLSDVTPDAVKIGMVYSGEAIREVARLIRGHITAPVVLDPMIRASAGGDLLERDAVHVLKEVLFPLVDVVTPNLEEAALLSGTTVRDWEGMEEAARKIKGMGPDVVVTGGGLGEACVDLLYDGRDVYRFSGPEIQTPHTHGSGCVFSSAMAVFLAEEGDPVKAAGSAHAVTREAIRGGYPCGKGSGPVRMGL
jgi:hydroxymethylpyrimidine kinase/phosphomethylpyrimidine kinase